MKRIFFYLLASIVVTGICVQISCNKDNKFIPPPPMAQFGGILVNLAFENNLPTAVYPIPIGLTALSQKDVTVSFSVFSPTGAENGKEYTLTDSSATIKAGSMSDTSLHITFDTSYYENGRTDTLILSINSNSSGIEVFKEDKTLILVISKNCPLILSEYGGTYNIEKDPWEDFIQNGYTSTIITVVNDSTLSFPSPLSKKPVVLHVNRLINELTVSDTDGSYGDYGTGPVTVTSSGGVAENYISSPCDVDRTINLNLTYAAPGYGTYPNQVLILQKE